MSDEVLIYEYTERGATLKLTFPKKVVIDEIRDIIEVSMSATFGYKGKGAN